MVTGAVLRLRLLLHLYMLLFIRRYE